MTPSKDVDSPFVPDWQSLVLIIVIGSVANTAGVGGGAIFVPLFQALVGFSLKESQALSQALITAGAIVSVLLNLFSPSPVEPCMPLINFSLVLLLLPVLLVGVGIGVLLNIILPSYLISILLFLLMCLLIVQSLSKGIQMWKMETRTKALAQSIQEKQQEQQTTGAGDVDSSLEQPLNCSALSCQAQEPGEAAALAAIEEDAHLGHHPRAACLEEESLLPEGEPSLLGAQGREPGAGAEARGRLSRRGSSFGFVQDWRRFRPDAALLPSRMLAPNAPNSWCNRRNAWLVRFVHACNELGAEGPAPPAPPSPLQPQQPQQPAAGRPSRSSERAGGRMHRSLSMPRTGLYTPLLSAEDSAAALAPHGRLRLPPEQWQRSLGCTEEELLAALNGDVPLSRARNAGAGDEAARAAGESPAPARLPPLDGRCGDSDNADPRPASPSLRLIVEAEAAAEAGADGDGASSCCRREPPRLPAPGLPPRLRAHVREGWARLPKALLLLLLGCWLAYLGLQLGRTLSGTCSTTYWALFAAQLAAMPAFAVAAALWIERQRRQQVHVQELELICMEGRAGRPAGAAAEEREGEGEGKLAGWSTFFMYQALAITAGIVGGLLGLGGGMIIGPVLLELGVQPQVSSATSSAMVLFSSSTALVSLAALGMLNLPYAAVFSVASMVASVLGVAVVGSAIRRTGRVSLVVLALASVMLVGGCAVGGFGVTTIMDAVSSGDMGPSPLCPS